jgi:hypothetical protein
MSAMFYFGLFFLGSVIAVLGSTGFLDQPDFHFGMIFTFLIGFGMMALGISGLYYVMLRD